MGSTDRPGELEDRLGYRFAEPRLLAAALTHRSAVHESELVDDYERLEFLGDAVLGLVTADRLYRELRGEAEGELTRRKSGLVSAVALVGYARHVGLGDHLVLGHGEELSGGRDKDSLLADSMEAVFGAVFLDGGLEAARRVIGVYLDFQRSSVPVERDAKSELQEVLQALGRSVPEYLVVGEIGPDHAKSFDVEARVEGGVVGRGRGASKKAAEQAAATAALEDRAWEQS